MSAERVRVAYNAPDGSYIGYVEGEPEVAQVLVTAAEIDAQNAAEQAATFDHAEQARQDRDGRGFVPGTLQVFPATNEFTRERLAREVAIAKFAAAGVAELEISEPAPPASVERDTPAPPAP